MAASSDGISKWSLGIAVATLAVTYLGVAAAVHWWPLTGASSASQLQTLSAPTPSHSPTLSSSPIPSPSPTIQQCQTSGLTIVVAGVHTMGSVSFIPIDFINSFGRSCYMYGFPGVAFVTNHHGKEIGRSATFDYTGGGGVDVMLAQGAIVHAWLAVYDPKAVARCDPVTAQWLSVWPPNQYKPRYVDVSYTTLGYRILACARKTQQSWIFPIRPGKARADRIP
jgi:Protein of unknown function (DUF4232)